MDPLANPAWHALTSDHRHLAVGDAALKGYPVDVAPFGAVPEPGGVLSIAASGVVLQTRHPVYFIGAIPNLPPWLDVEHDGDLVQMAWDRSPPPATSTDPNIRRLDGEDVDAMLALTGLAFPGFFRTRTIVMGRYFGIFEQGRLVAMGGERLSLPGLRELSGICTHPDRAGRGYASAIVLHVVRVLLDEAIVPLLHVSPENTRARALYTSLGFVHSRTMRMVRVVRRT